MRGAGENGTDAERAGQGARVLLRPAFSRIACGYLISVETQSGLPRNRCAAKRCEVLMRVDWSQRRRGRPNKRWRDFRRIAG